MTPSCVQECVRAYDEATHRSYNLQQKIDDLMEETTDITRELEDYSPPQELEALRQHEADLVQEQQRLQKEHDDLEEALAGPCS